MDAKDIMIRLSSEVCELLREKAYKDRTSVSGAIRSIIYKEFGKDAPEVKKGRPSLF